MAAANVTANLKTANVEFHKSDKINNLHDEEAEESSNKPHNRNDNFKKESSTRTGVPLDEYNNLNEVNLPDSRAAAWFSPLLRQVTAASPSILIAFVSGLTMGYVAILFTHLRHDSGSQVDMAAMAWIATMVGFPIAPGCLISSWIMEKFGRRTSLRIICVPLFYGWILTVAATISSVRIPLLLAGRFLTGICTGLSAPLSPIYIGETMEPKHRGFVLAGLSLAQAQGLLAIHILGSFLTWQWIACICCIFPLLAMGILFVIPESPTWLIANGRVEEGVKAFGWLRGYNDEANAELRGILEKQRRIDSEPAMNWLGKLRMLKSRELLKPLLIMTFFFIVSELSGENYVMFYIIEQAFVSNFNHYVAIQWLYVGIVVVFSLACVICQYTDRRHVCLFSGVITALSLICQTITCYFVGPGISWPPLLCLMVYIFAECIGLVPLPWVMCGEIFPTRIRGLGSGISSATYFFVSFVVVNCTPLMAQYLGYCIFLLHGALTLAGTVVLYYILPETKGKTLQEIEEAFKGIWYHRREKELGVLLRSCKPGHSRTFPATRDVTTSPFIHRTGCSAHSREVAL